MNYWLKQLIYINENNKYVRDKWTYEKLIFWVGTYVFGPKLISLYLSSWTG